MQIDNLEWQLIDENQWVFGRKVRGIVRDPIGEVYLDEERNPSWIWFVWKEGVDEGRVRNACNNLRWAIEAVEAEVTKLGLDDTLAKLFGGGDVETTT